MFFPSVSKLYNTRFGVDLYLAKMNVGLLSFLTDFALCSLDKLLSRSRFALGTISTAFTLPTSATPASAARLVAKLSIHKCINLIANL